MRVKPLDIGVESIGRWQVEDEVHLPETGPRSPVYLPHYRALDEILRRPSLDERVPRMLQPQRVDPDLMEPAVLTETRLSTRRAFQRAADRAMGKRRKILEMAVAALTEDAAMDEEIRLSLGALLRG